MIAVLALALIGIEIAWLAALERPQGAYGNLNLRLVPGRPTLGSELLVCALIGLLLRGPATLDGDGSSRAKARQRRRPPTRRHRGR